MSRHGDISSSEGKPIDCFFSAQFLAFSPLDYLLATSCSGVGVLLNLPNHPFSQ